ncbi:MAG: UxaA family hydrolase [Burkholderiaceae bacterium]
MSETAEFMPGEPVIRQQSASPSVAERILACLAREETMMKEDGDDYRGVNPTAENIDAGLTTLIEKSMGAVCKITSPLVGCLEFAERPGRRGLYFMDTPFFSPVSITGMVCAGSQLTLFAMGVVNPSGCPLAPTVKICGNPRTMRTWGDEIDVDVSGLIDATQTLAQAAGQIADAVARCARGEQTRTEARGEGQLIVPRTLAAL